MKCSGDKPQCNQCFSRKFPDACNYEQSGRVRNGDKSAAERVLPPRTSRKRIRFDSEDSFEENGDVISDLHVFGSLPSHEVQEPLEGRPSPQDGVDDVQIEATAMGLNPIHPWESIQTPASSMTGNSMTPGPPMSMGLSKEWDLFSNIVAVNQDAELNDLNLWHTLAYGVEPAADEPPHVTPTSSSVTLSVGDLTDADTNILLNAYWYYANTFIPIIHRSLYDETRLPHSVALTNAMFLTGIKFTDRWNVAEKGKMISKFVKDIQSGLSRKVTEMGRGGVLEFDPMMPMQALNHLLFYVQSLGHGKAGEELIKLGLDLLNLLNLTQLEPRSPMLLKSTYAVEFPFIYNELRIRTFWNFVVMDRAGAAISQREPFFKQTDYTGLPLPCPDRVFDIMGAMELEQTLKMTWSSRPRMENWLPLNANDPHRYSWLRNVIGSLCDGSYYGMAVIASELNREARDFQFWCIKNGLDNCDSAAGELQDEMIARRMRVRQNCADYFFHFPAEVREYDAKGDGAGLLQYGLRAFGPRYNFHLATLYMVGHFAQLTLWAPISPQLYMDPRFLTGPNFQGAAESAILTSRILVGIMRVSPDLEWLAPQLAYAILLCGMTHLACLMRLRRIKEEVGADFDDKLITGLERDLAACLDSCRTVSRRWEYVDAIYHMFIKTVKGSGYAVDVGQEDLDVLKWKSWAIKGDAELMQGLDFDWSRLLK